MISNKYYHWLHLQITALDNNNVTYIIPEKLKLLYSDNDMLESINYNNNNNTFLLLESTVYRTRRFHEIIDPFNKTSLCRISVSALSLMKPSSLTTLSVSRQSLFILHLQFRHLVTCTITWIATSVHDTDDKVSWKSTRPLGVDTKMSFKFCKKVSNYW